MGHCIEGTDANRGSLHLSPAGRSDGLGGPAGGGFRHGKHLKFDPQDPPPLCNLYGSMLQRLGIETDRFSSGTRTLTGLTPVG